MLDTIGTIAASATYSILTILLIGLSNINIRAKIIAYGAALLWAVLIFGAASAGLFLQDAIGPVPGPVLAFSILLLMLLGSYFLFPNLRKALLAVPLPVLIAANTARLFGVFFLILLANNRLSAPFATAAGWGDIVVGLLAIPVAIMATKNNANKSIISFWNFIGALDLVTAVTLGALSAPTPIRVFTTEPGTLAMGQLPWLMIPTMLVPLFLLIHTVIAAKIRLWRKDERYAGLNHLAKTAAQ